MFFIFLFVIRLISLSKTKFQFLQQYRHYKSTKLVFEMKPDQNNKSMDDLVMFLAQVYLDQTSCSFTHLFTLISITGSSLFPSRLSRVSTRANGYVTKTSHNFESRHAKGIYNSCTPLYSQLSNLPLFSPDILQGTYIAP